jgi:hypothetical protein
MKFLSAAKWAASNKLQQAQVPPLLGLASPPKSLFGAFNFNFPYLLLVPCHQILLWADVIT